MTNTDKAIHFDALGNPIKIGKTYGFAKNENGFTKITIGIAKKYVDRGITLDVIKCVRALYDDDPEPYETGLTVTIRGMMLFPIFNE